jgi:hypothetical protein
MIIDGVDRETDCEGTERIWNFVSACPASMILSVEHASHSSRPLTVLVQVSLEPLLDPVLPILAW